MLREAVKIYRIIPDKRPFWLLASLAVFSSLVSVYPYTILGWLVDLIAASTLADFSVGTELNILFIQFVVVSFAAVVVRNLFGILASNYGAKIIAYYREQVFTSIATDHKNQYSNLDLGEKVQRTMGDTANLEQAISYPLTSFLSDILDVVWVSVLLFIIHWSLLAFAWIAVPPIVWLAWIQSKGQSKLFEEISLSDGQLINSSQRVYDNRVSILSLRGEQREIGRFREQIKENLNAQFQLSKQIGLLFTAEGLGRQLGLVLVALCALFLLNGTSITIGETVTALGLSTRFFSPIGAIARFSPKLRGAIVSIDRINQIISSKITSAVGSSHHENLKLEFSDPVVQIDADTSISYKMKSVLKAGEILLIQGPSGTGKSSLLLAIQGVTGDLRSGVSVISSSQESKLCDVVQYVSATGSLLTNSLEEEIFYPLDSAKFNSKKLADILEEFGLSHLAKRDRQLLKSEISDGERVRLILARAMITPRKIVMVDEPFINLDSASLLKVEDALIKMAKSGKSVLVVSHSVSKRFKSNCNIFPIVGNLFSRTTNSTF